MSEAAARAEGRAYRLYVLAILILVYTFNFLDRQIVAILAKPIKAEFHLSDGQFGLLSGLGFALVYSTLAVPIAWLADRWSRSWIISISLGLWSGFTALCGTAQGFWPLFAFRTGVGIGEAGGVAPSYSMISDYFPPAERARAIAAYSFAIPIGTALGVGVGGVIAANWGWRAAFLAVGLSGLLLAPLLKLTVRDPARGGAQAPGGGKASAGAPRLGRVLKTLLSKPSFWLLAFGAAAASVCGYGVAFWLPSFFQRSLGFSLVHSAWFFAGIFFIGGLAGIWAGGALADRFGGRSRAAYPTVPALAFLAALPVFFLAVQSDNRALSFLLFLIPIGLNLAWLGPIVTAVHHLVPATMRSTASALFLLINNLLGIAGGLYYFGAVSDLLAPRFGEQSLRWAIYSGMGFYVLAAALFLLAARRLAKDWVD
ncbi:MAG TPA: MFS transporter [Caulobacteraceae bacterium]|jgi:predicted MFS family arabinose efflux permease